MPQFWFIKNLIMTANIIDLNRLSKKVKTDVGMLLRTATKW